MRLTADDWLSGLFGYPALRVELSDVEDARVCRRALAECCDGKRVLCFAKVATTRVEQAVLLTDLGFRVVDVNVTFERVPGDRTEGTNESGVTIAGAAPTDHGQLIRIAGSCFTFSRFHLDPLIPPEVANLVKRAWVQSYLSRERGETILVARREGRPVGFLAVLTAESAGRRARVIDLVAVDRDRQGHGVGRVLVDHFIATSVGRCDVLRVGTQVANVPSIRLYEECGFRVVRSEYVLHGHFGTGTVP